MSYVIRTTKQTHNCPEFADRTAVSPGGARCQFREAMDDAIAAKSTVSITENYAPAGMLKQVRNTANAVIENGKILHVYAPELDWNI